MRFNANMEALAAKVVISTPHLDFELLEELGILDEFTRLTERVGFRQRFWKIPTRYPAYIELTKEFLVSLAFAEVPNKGSGISFRLGGHTYLRTFTRLAEWFHVDLPDTAYLGYIPEDQINHDDPVSQAALRAAFWPRLTGRQLPVTANPDPRVNLIVYPALRFICHTLGHSIFAGGESSLRPRHEEFQLLATMLRPDAQLQRPDLMLQMVRF